MNALNKGVTKMNAKKLKEIRDRSRREEVKMLALSVVLIVGWLAFSFICYAAS